MGLIRPLAPEDLDALPELWSASPWADDAEELQEAARAATGADSSEHRALCSVERDDVEGVVLYRMVAGAVGTGEIECVAAREYSLATILVAVAMSKLRDLGARLIVAEYPGSPAYNEYAALLNGAGLNAQASIGDYFEDGVPLVIATRQLG